MRRTTTPHYGIRAYNDDHVGTDAPKLPHKVQAAFAVENMFYIDPDGDVYKMLKKTVDERDNEVVIFAWFPELDGEQYFVLRCEKLAQLNQAVTPA